MTRNTPSTPTIPTQAEIDAAIGRGSRLRSRSFRDAFAAIFSMNSDRRAARVVYPR